MPVGHRLLKIRLWPLTIWTYRLVPLYLCLAAPSLLSVNWCIIEMWFLASSDFSLWWPTHPLTHPPLPCRLLPWTLLAYLPLPVSTDEILYLCRYFGATVYQQLAIWSDRVRQIMTWEIPLECHSSTIHHDVAINTHFTLITSNPLGNLSIICSRYVQQYLRNWVWRISPYWRPIKCK